ncbi:MAG: hypothetical protein IE880_08205, partial [Epsilonproteobacteria bacterium]|nr:hypothetical protein [Campylobacterota bacterium]
RIGHGLHADGCIAADGYVSDIYFFSWVSLYHEVDFSLIGIKEGFDKKA